jgi:uncharacterized membrane protein YuzA (DUF378 family)
MKVIEMIGYVLVVVGGLNWGLVGLGGFAGADWNVVKMLLGYMPQVEWTVYVLVGLATVWMVVMKSKN